MTNSVNVSGGSSGSINVNATNSTTNASATSASGSSSVETVNNAAWFWANIAKEWAIKMSGLVQGEDYSSKYWAQESKGYAEQAEEIIQSKDEILAELEQEGNTQIGLIENAGTEQIGLVEDSADAQIERIEDAGDTQITNITNVSNTNIATINGLIGDALSAANAAANSAQSASDSATSASNSSTSASNSANSAQTSATGAANSASSASDSATAAATSAQSAAGSATSASNSATAASGSASSAQSSATSASNSASSASGSATSASNSATSAANSASAAATSEDNAEIWAEGTDEEVQALGGVHSAKGWADVSSAGQIQADWEEEDTTSKAYIRNKPSNFASSISDLTDVDLTGLSNGDVLVYDSTSQEWKAEAQSGGVDLIAGTDLEIVPLLPSGHTQLKSITATGSQYINTGAWLTDNFKAVIVGRFTDTTGTQCVLGATMPTSAATYKNIVLAKDASKYFVNNGNPWLTNQTNSSAPLDTNRHTFVIEITSSSTKISVDGTTNTGNYSNVTLDEDLFLFARNAVNASPAITDFAKFELEAIELYNNGELVFNGIPDKYGNKAGLYDTITSTFMPSLSATDFVAGEEIATQNVINFTNKTGYITGIDSTDVITALGYTPYNSTNPDNYISSAAVSTLTDVTLSSPANGQGLVYNSTTQKWENGAVSSTGQVTIKDWTV